MSEFLLLDRVSTTVECEKSKVIVTEINFVHIRIYGRPNVT